MEAGTTETAQERQTYEIDGVRYRIEPASYRQHRWLAEGPLKGVDLGNALDYAEQQTIIQQHGPEILGIVLLAEGQTRVDKARAGRQAAQDLAEVIECALTPEEVRQLAEDFFVGNGIGNFWFCIDFPALAARMQAETTEKDFAPLSVSSPAATSPSEPPSSEGVVLATASPISGGSLNGSSLT